MDEQRKNPYRRPGVAPAASAERRPGLRQLPSDLEDLALGKAERLYRPRPQPNPLQDEREGAVIPGVRNSEARVVYDARVSSLRATLEAGSAQEAELLAGLEEVRQLLLWRARNVTDYRAFMESVVGVAPALAQSLVEAAEQDATPPLPDHAVALAIRVEAALVARDDSARLRVVRSANGLSLAVDVPLLDIGRAVEVLSDVGIAATGLRRFLRGPDGAVPQAPSFESRDEGRDRRPPRDAFRREGGGDRDRDRPRDDGRSSERRGPPPRRPPPSRAGGFSDDRRGPERKGPPGPDDRRGPPRKFASDDRRGPPPRKFGSDDRRGPPPRKFGSDDRRGPPPPRKGPPSPDDRRRPPAKAQFDDRRGPPRKGPPSPDDRRGPPRKGPPGKFRRP